MQRAKQLISEHFELALVVALVAATAIIILVAPQKIAFLNIFYIPVLVASYFLGRRQGVLAALVAILLVTIYAILNPAVLLPNSAESPAVALTMWGLFLLVTAYVVGSLYEIKARALADLRQAYDGVLELLSRFIDAADKYSDDHSVRIADLAAKIAVVMDVPNEQIDDIRVGGLLHDVGKVDLSLDVLRKASSLTDSEWEQIRSHTDAGKRLLSHAGGTLDGVVPLVECHHEHFDGSGYLGMAGEDIPLGARILAVADAYVSMLADRPYRMGRTPEDALSEIELCSGSQFDPMVVDAFLIVVRLSPSLTAV